MIKEVNIPHIRELLKGIPKEDLPNDLSEFWLAVAIELAEMYRLSCHAKAGHVWFADKPRKAGEQYVWEFALTDMRLPVEDKWNFHGHNTSQWIYAGCILLCKGKVSAHH